MTSMQRLFRHRTRRSGDHRDDDRHHSGRLHRYHRRVGRAAWRSVAALDDAAEILRPRLAAGVVSASGTLGILIPPSIMLVIMADQMALSVGDLFMAAVFPGIIIGALYLTYIFVIALIKRDVAPVPEGAKAPGLGRRASDVLIAVIADARV